jgi:hypothetical protein
MHSLASSNRGRTTMSTILVTVMLAHLSSVPPVGDQAIAGFAPSPPALIQIADGNGNGNGNVGNNNGNNNS